ncbi:MMPL family transporter [Paenibacillus daejeonensis]|uniref:MMPL family transporter n=1 Tax=Paenibacillus daejeonensis TaxID=135193 RepID=UPI0003645AB2|nr:MMPL family transporter [Paenibacillus daejeonensis]
MRTVLKFKWLILALWIAASVGLMFTAPNMEQLVREKGQITVPDGYSSTEAAKLAAELGGSEGGGELSSVLVFHNEAGLTPEDHAEIERAIDHLQSEGSAVGVTSVMTHLETPELADQMVAEDGKTILALIGSDLGDRSYVELREDLDGLLSDVQVEHYYTGNWLIGEDVVQSSQEGLRKTEIITLFFILAILFLVFRSAVAPLIPLVTVGLSYLLSQSVVAYLVEYADFPLSNFTQIFMVAVMFGIGTDYCILLISRFKEELAHSGDKTEAVLNTYKHAGRTVFFAGLAVLVGFSAIGFSEFTLYRSAVAVAVGIAVLLIALVTIVPFFMATMGKTIFWPARGSLEHKPSGLWGAMGRFSLKRPVWALVLLALVTVPFLSVYEGKISFNSLDEIGDSYDSVRGFQIISDSFGPGDTLPSTLVMRADEPLDTPEGMAAMEQISRELASVEGVKAVRSATRPTGEALDDFLVTQQVEQLGDGLGEGKSGLQQIEEGLAEASQALSDNAPQLEEAVSGTADLIGGTRELQAGVVQLGDGLRQIEQGMRDGSAGAGEIRAGLAQAQASAEQLAGAAQELLTSYQQLGSGLNQITAGYEQFAGAQAELAQGLSGAIQGLSALGEQYPELQDDATYTNLAQQMAVLQGSAEAMTSGLTELNTQLAGIASGMEQANAGLQQASGGQSALAQGLSELVDGIAQLQNGLDQAAGGQSQIVTQLPELTGGFDQLAEGQEQLQAGFAELGGQLTELTDGLDQSVDGLQQVSGGLESAQSYLTELSQAPNQQLSGWFIPEEAIGMEEFQQALDVYLSEDRQIAKFDVVFEGNPYAQDTMDQIEELSAAADRGLRSSGFQQATFAIDGVTSMNHDLDTISNNDYSRTVMLMIIGIGLILILLLRSIVMPIYLILSLLLTYYTSMAIAEVLFVRILGYAGISWAVPFFGFVMLMALGIDYSIFLMDRFKEYRDRSPREAILMAMKNMGTVIISAAIILGGTFAAMLPSGVLSLLQIATVVLCGLFMYALLMLPLFVPVMVRTFGEANWWPFMKRRDEDLPAPGTGRDIGM